MSKAVHEPWHGAFRGSSLTVNSCPYSLIFYPNRGTRTRRPDRVRATLSTMCEHDGNPELAAGDRRLRGEHSEREIAKRNQSGWSFATLGGYANLPRLTTAGEHPPDCIAVPEYAKAKSLRSVGGPCCSHGTRYWETCCGDGDCASATTVISSQRRDTSSVPAQVPYGIARTVPGATGSCRSALAHAAKQSERLPRLARALFVGSRSSSMAQSSSPMVPWKPSGNQQPASSGEATPSATDNVTRWCLRSGPELRIVPFVPVR